jgi:hypothetical protein
LGEHTTGPGCRRRFGVSRPRDGEIGLDDAPEGGDLDRALAPLSDRSHALRHLEPRADYSPPFSYDATASRRLDKLLATIRTALNPGFIPERAFEYVFTK